MLNIFPHHSVTQITTLLRPGFSDSFTNLPGFYLMTGECYGQEGDSYPSPRPPQPLPHCLSGPATEGYRTELEQSKQLLGEIRQHGGEAKAGPGKGSLWGNLATVGSAFFWLLSRR